MGQVIRDVRLFERLKEDPGWQRLADIVRAKKDKWLLTFTRRQMAGEVVDQREIDYHRGFYDGCAYIIDVPEKALENLESVARKAYALATIEQLQAEGDDTPYA